MGQFGHYRKQWTFKARCQGLGQFGQPAFTQANLAEGPILFFEKAAKVGLYNFQSSPESLGNEDDILAQNGLEGRRVEFQMLHGADGNFHMNKLSTQFTKPFLIKITLKHP